VADKKSSNDGSMRPFVYVFGAVGVIAIGAVVWSQMSGAFTDASLEPIELEYVDLQELAEMAVGVEVGDPDAPITIMEFGDYQCPSCQHFASNVKPQIDLAYVHTGTARFVFHDFPLSQHPHAFLASRAARCALDQGSEYYWPYHDLLFRHQASWSPSPGPPLGDFESYAEEIGLDGGEFEGCLNSDRFAEVVTANVQLGTELGVSGTPTLYVSGNDGRATRVTRWGEFEGIQEVVEAILQAQDGG
jgi:protein-disulfide isomerase